MKSSMENILNNKYFKYSIKIIGIILFILSIVWLLFFSAVDSDDKDRYRWATLIWQGQLPYKDFNMLQTPLSIYYYALFFKISDSIISFRLCNLSIILLLGLMLIKISKKINKKTVFPIIYLYTIFLIITPNSIYNLLSMFIWLSGVYLYLQYKETNKNKYLIFIGIITALCFYTKQNVGLLMLGSLGIVFIRYWIVSKTAIKQALKSAVTLWTSYIITILTGLSIFYIIGNLDEFIEYTLTASNEFLSSYNVYLVAIVLLLNIIASILLAIQFKQLELGIFSVTSIAIMFPIPNISHMMTAWIFIVLIISGIDIKDIINIFIQIALSLICIVGYGYVMINNTDVEVNKFEFKHMIEYYDTKDNHLLPYLDNKDLSKYHIIDGCAGWYSIHYDNYDNYYDLFLPGNLGHNTNIDIVKHTMETEKGNYFIVRNVDRNYVNDENTIFYGKDYCFNGLLDAMEYIKENCEFIETITNNETGFSVYKIN